MPPSRHLSLPLSAKLLLLSFAWVYPPWANGTSICYLKDFFKILFKLYLYACFTCMPVCAPHVHLGPTEVRRGLGSSGTGVEDGCEPQPLGRCWEQNPGPRRNNNVKTVEPSLQSLSSRTSQNHLASPSSLAGGVMEPQEGP